MAQNKNEVTKRRFYTLVIDLAEETRISLSRSAKQDEAFKDAFRRFYNERCSTLLAADDYAKFLGDGYIITTDKPEHVVNLILVAFVFRDEFHRWILSKTTLAAESVPGIHIGIAGGRGIWIEPLQAGRPEPESESCTWAARLSKTGTINCINVKQDIVDDEIRNVDFGYLKTETTKDGFELVYRVALHPKQRDIAGASSSDRPYQVVEQLAIASVLGGQALEEAALESVEFIESPQAVLNPDYSKLASRVIALLYRDDKHELAKKVYDKLTQYGGTPSIQVFESLIGYMNSLDEGKAIISQMKAKGVSPNQSTYNSLLALAHSLEDAKAIITEMQMQGVKPDLATYQIICGLGKASKEGEVLADRLVMESGNMDIFTYDAIRELRKLFLDVSSAQSELTRQTGNANAVAGMNFLEIADSLHTGVGSLKEIKDSSCELDLFTNYSVNNMMLALERAQSVFLDILDEGINSIDTRSDLFGELLRQVKCAVEHVEQMRPQTVRDDIIVDGIIGNLSGKLQKMRTVIVELMKRSAECEAPYGTDSS